METSTSKLPKPRIWKESWATELMRETCPWLCAVLSELCTVNGAGKTPREAYNDWLEKFTKEQSNAPEHRT